MSGCKIIGLLVVLTALGGCRGAAPVTSSPVVDVRQVAAIEPSPRSHTIVFTTFIPVNHILSPRLHPQSYTGPAPLMRRLVFAGDDRDFDPHATRFRSRQVVTLGLATVDEADAVQVSERKNLGGKTEAFAAGVALEDGRLDAADRERINQDSIGYYEAVDVATDGMVIDDPVRLGPKKASVRLHTKSSGGPRDQLIAGAPSIDWDLTVTLDASGPEVKYTVVGKWDGYPACEMYIDGHPVFRSSPGRAVPSAIDLLKLMPGYGDMDVNESGVLP